VNVASIKEELRKELMAELRPQKSPQNFKRDYDRDPELRVTGGIEVKHPDGFLPLPPSYINPYVSKDGGETVYLDPYVVVEKKAVPKKDEAGKIIVTSEGNQVYEEQDIQVVKDPGAARDKDGNPILTDSYKHWLQVRWVEGGRLTNDVRTNMAVGQFVAEDERVVGA